MATSEYQIINKVLDTKDYGIIYNNEIDENNFIMCKDEFNYIKDFYDKYKEDHLRLLFLPTEPHSLLWSSDYNW